MAVAHRPKHSAKQRPVPPWDALDPSVREALTPPGYGRAWYAHQTPALCLTVLNLHRKLSRLGLWRFVARESSTNLGNLEFICTDVAALRAQLVHHPHMGATGPWSRRWSSREWTSRAALHLKHFPGWPIDKVQAHIDPHGFDPVWVAGLVPVVSPKALCAHLGDLRGYMDVWTIQDLLDADEPCDGSRRSTPG